jgi:hypothetical protein
MADRVQAQIDIFYHYPPELLELLCDAVPVLFRSKQGVIIVVGRPLDGPYHRFGGWTFISPNYFDVFNIPVLRGRAFTERDDADAPAAVIINEAMAKALWPTSDPLGERLIIGRGMRPEYEKDSPRQIIGFVGDVRDTVLNRPPRPAMYVPIAQLPDGIEAEWSRFQSEVFTRHNKRSRGLHAFR